MKKYIYIMTVASLAFLFQACQSDAYDAGALNTGELMLTPVVTEMKTSGTRAIGDDFFETGSEIEVDLTIETSDGSTSTHTYNYSYGADRIFKGTPSGYRFPLDDTFIETLEAKWPINSVRGNGLKTDQRLLADYKSADWMSGGLDAASVGGIVATNTPVPLVFTRENVLLDFELVGQNTTGLNIESLLIELQNTSGSVAYWAYCGNPNGHAELIMEAGSRILSEDNYLIGRIRVAGQNSDYTIIFPKTDLTLEKGHRYLITLTPQGYFMNAYVYISGFAEADEGIGIPFQQPTPDMNGNFLINTPAQLITMSYLMRHYDDGTSFVWTERTYVISDALVMSESDVERYLPIPVSIFAGSIQDTQGIAVTSVNTTSGDMLPLFDNNN